MLRWFGLPLLLALIPVTGEITREFLKIRGTAARADNGENHVAEKFSPSIRIGTAERVDSKSSTTIILGDTTISNNAPASDRKLPRRASLGAPPAPPRPAPDHMYRPESSAQVTMPNQPAEFVLRPSDQRETELPLVGSFDGTVTIEVECKAPLWRNSPFTFDVSLELDRKVIAQKQFKEGKADRSSTQTLQWSPAGTFRLSANALRLARAVVKVKPVEDWCFRNYDLGNQPDGARILSGQLRILPAIGSKDPPGRRAHRR